MSERLTRAALVAFLVAAVAAPSPAAATVDTPVDAGDIVVVDANNRRRPMTEGDSNTIFSVRLPDGSTCPGDSANDDWRVQSFVVPAEMDPGALEYGALRPVGDNLHALYGADTRPYVQAFLGQNSGAGQPGQILDAPALSFGVFPAGFLQPGSYRIGVACTLFRDTAKFWDAEIELIADPAVQPGGFRWRLSEASVTEAFADPSDRDAGSGRWLFVAIGAVAVAGGLAVRSRFTSRSPIKETTS